MCVVLQVVGLRNMKSNHRCVCVPYTAHLHLVTPRKLHKRSSAQKTGSKEASVAWKMETEAVLTHFYANKIHFNDNRQGTVFVCGLQVINGIINGMESCYILISYLHEGLHTLYFIHRKCWHSPPHPLVQQLQAGPSFRTNRMSDLFIMISIQALQMASGDFRPNAMQMRLFSFALSHTKASSLLRSSRCVIIHVRHDW